MGCVCDLLVPNHGDVGDRNRVGDFFTHEVRVQSVPTFVVNGTPCTKVGPSPGGGSANPLVPNLGDLGDRNRVGDFFTQEVRVQSVPTFVVNGTPCTKVGPGPGGEKCKPPRGQISEISEIEFEWVIFSPTKLESRAYRHLL